MCRIGLPSWRELCPAQQCKGGCTEQEQIVFLLQLLLGPDRCIVAPSLSIQVGLLVLESSLQGGAIYTYISHRNILHKKSVLLRTATKPMLLTHKAPLPSGSRRAEAESAPRGFWRHPFSDFPARFSRAHSGSASSACLLGASDAVES